MITLKRWRRNLLGLCLVIFLFQRRSRKLKIRPLKSLVLH